MPRSICGSAAFAALVAAAFPALSAEPGARANRPVVVTSASKTAIEAAVPAVAEEPAADEPQARKRPATPRRRPRVVTMNSQREPAPESATRGQADRDEFVKPFRKIGEILPYDTYDPLSPADDRERYPSNLCPCPEGQECPESCPKEKFLRRIGRAEGEPDRPFIPRDFAHINYVWEPTNLYHHPIYFEDVPLERYGHTRHYLIQPVFSGAKFAVQLLGLPYQMTLYPCCSRQYSLGYYRPGECAPYKYYQIPLNACAALVEAGFVTGGYFLFAPGVGP
jgi:hypothetical protein